MNKIEKKYYYAFLGIIVLVTLAFFISEGGYAQLKNSVANNCLQFAKKCREWKFYQLANLNCRIVLKLRPDIKYMNFAIAYNNYLDAKYNNEYNSIRRKKLANEAIVLYREESKLHPNDYVIYQNLAATYELIKDYEKAMPNYEYAVKLNNKDAYSYGRLSFLETHVYKNYDKALEYSDKYFEYEKHPYDEDYFQHAFILSSLDRDKEAIEYYKIYLDKHPTSVAALVNISGCEVEIQDYENAQKHVDLGLKYNSHSSYLISKKIDLLIHKKDFIQAKKLADDMFERDKYSGYISYWKYALIERKKGNLAEAEKYYQMSKQNAQEYYDKYCHDKPYDLDDIDGNCSNRYRHITEFEKNKAKPLKL